MIVEFSRRNLLAVGALAAAPLTANCVGADENPDDVIRNTVTRLSWMFTQPRNQASGACFGLKRGNMYRDLKAYRRIFAERFKRNPDPEHLFVAGTVIHSCEYEVTIGSRRRSSLCDMDTIITAESFERTLSITLRRLESLRR